MRKFLLFLLVALIGFESTFFSSCSQLKKVETETRKRHDNNNNFDVEECGGGGSSIEMVEFVHDKIEPPSNIISKLFEITVLPSYCDPNALSKENICHVVLFNFIEAHFYGYNTFLKRVPIERIQPIELRCKLNRSALHKLMANSDLVRDVIGYEMCFEVIKLIIEAFKPFITVAVDQKFRAVIRRVCENVNDFLEFVLEEIVPKYTIDPTDKEYSRDAFIECEYTGFCVLEGTIRILDFIPYDNVDFIVIIIDRYYKNMAPKVATALFTMIMRRCENLHLIHLFRPVLALFVRRFPQSFVGRAKLSQYPLHYDYNRFSYIRCTFGMAPVLYSLLMLDPLVIIQKHLYNYFDFIKQRTNWDPNYNFHACKVFNFMLLDANFALSQSGELKDSKRIILEMILVNMFGIKDESGLSHLISSCLSFKLLVLYEVLLQHFHGCLDQTQRFDLLIDSVRSVCVDALLITLSYLDFTMEEISRVKLHDFRKRNSRIRIIEESYVLLGDCPIKRSQSIFTDDQKSIAIIWRCPYAIILALFQPDLADLDPYYGNDHISDSSDSDDDDENNNKAVTGEQKPKPKKLDLKKFEIYKHLFDYSRIILAKAFHIPILFSKIDLDFSEIATWQEAVSFMNFMIERTSSIVRSADDKFIVGEHVVKIVDPFQECLQKILSMSMY